MFKNQIFKKPEYKKIIKKSFFILSLILFFCFSLGFSVFAQSTETENNKKTAIEKSENKIYEEITDALDENQKETLEEYGLLPQDGFLNNFNFNNLKNMVLSFLKSSYKQPLTVVLSFLSASLIMGAFNEFLKKNEYFYKFINLSAAATLLLPLFSVLKGAYTAICGVSKFMLSFVPTYFATVIAGGNINTAGYISPIMLTVITAISALASNGFLPAMAGYLGLTVAGSFTNLNLLKIAESIKNAAIYIMGGALTLFSAVLSLGGTVAAAGDNVALKTTKFFISGVPMIGGTLSESLNAVKASAELLKSTVGVFGIVSVGIMLLPLVISLILWKISLFVSSFFAETLGSEILGNFLKTVSFVVSLVLGISVFVGMIFIIGLAILLKG